jgi:glycosyltransferase involved in cell wall biosynthesis
MNILLRNQLAFISQHFEVFGVSSRDNKHFPEITQREGVPMVAIEMTRNISPIKDLKALVKMIRFFLKEKPAIVHSHTPKAGLIAMTAAKITRVPVRLHTLAGMPLMEAKGARRWLLGISERITYGCSTAIFPNSNGLKQFVLEKNLARPEKVKIIGNGSSNGVDLAFFSKNAWEDPDFFWETQRAQWGIDKADFVFCFVGRLVRDKGLKELVEAFLEIKSSFMNMASGRKLKLLLIGPWVSGRDEPDALTRAQIKNHPDIIHAGRHDDIRPFLMTADVFVFPSYREGFPNAVLQAGAMGLPCIVSNINGCNEIIIDGENGLIVPPKNSTRLFEAMSRLLNDKNLRTKLAANARPMIASRYDQKAFWAELLKTYQEYLSKANLVNEKP